MTKRAKTESFADWMARIDASVDAAVKRIERQPLTYDSLNPAQKCFINMLIEHLRSLPRRRRNECAFRKPEYAHVNYILTILYCAKYPAFARSKRTDRDNYDIANLPNGEDRTCEWILRNCASGAPAED